MNKNKGQALVEFVMILPILILLIMGTFDFGNILIKKNEMQSYLDDIVLMYDDNNIAGIESYTRDKGVKVSYSSDSDFLNITVSKDTKIITPGLMNVLGSPYTINVERSIYKHE